MKYVKPALTYEQQADLLIDRGLLADRAMLIERLKAVNYYRLSGYLFPYRMEKDTYLPDTTLDLVWRHYTFDRQLRLLVMDPIERIEVAVRTALAYELAASTGAFGYTSPSNLPNLKADEFAYFISKLYKQTTQSAERL